MRSGLWWLAAALLVAGVLLWKSQTPPRDGFTSIPRPDSPSGADAAGHLALPESHGKHTPIVYLADHPRAGDRGRQLISLDDHWAFQRSQVPWGQVTALVDAGWPVVNLPHTWNHLDGQDGGESYYRGVGWYRKHLTLPADAVGKRVFLSCDGANTTCDVFVNGTLIGHHAGGFSAFTFDVSEALVVGGDNLIACKVSNASDTTIPPLYAGFTFCGGLYRGMRLTLTQPVHLSLMHFGSSGVYLTPGPITAQQAAVEVRTKLRNDGTHDAPATVQVEVWSADNHPVARSAVVQVVPARSGADAVIPLTIPAPHLWDGLRDPYLYRVVVRVGMDGNEVDRVEQRLGLRTTRVDPERGFMLNGHPWDLHGVSLHQDRRDKGWATSNADQAQDVALLRELGATFVRLVHYQHPQHIYDLLDETGITAWTEIPCLMQVAGTPAFTTNCLQQLQELIYQNYNHPSIVCWGLFNEIGSGVPEQELLDRLIACAHEADPNRPTTAASLQPDEAVINHRTDLIGFNRYFGWFIPNYELFGPWADTIHHTYPMRPIGISEYGAGGSPAQHDAHPVQPTFGAISVRTSAHSEEYQALFHEVVWKQLAARPFLWCKAAWVLCDYAYDQSNEGGDMPGMCDFGLVTADRQIKKDAFFWYQSNWSAQPMIYVTGRRFAQRTSPTTIKVYSNLAQVTVTVNGVALPMQTSPDHLFKWEQVPLQRGRNQIVAASTSKDGHNVIDHLIWIVP